MILPLSQSKVKTDPLQAKAQAFAGLSILSPSLSNSFLRVPNPGRIAATTEQANPPGVYVSVKNNLIDCALRLIRSAAFLPAVPLANVNEASICNLSDVPFKNPLLNYINKREAQLIKKCRVTGLAWSGFVSCFLVVRWGSHTRHKINAIPRGAEQKKENLKIISNCFKSRSISRCVPRGEVFYISLPCDCVPFDWQ